MPRTRSAAIRQIPTCKRKPKNVTVVQSGRMTTGLWTGKRIGSGKFYDTASSRTLKGLNNAKCKLKFRGRTYVR